MVKVVLTVIGDVILHPYKE